MGIPSNPLSTVRQQLSGVVGDLILGTFASGSGTTGVHTMLRKGNDYYNEHHYRCYIFAGAGIGEEREVSDWDLATHTLTFDPTFVATIGATSQYELHHIFTEAEYRRAINAAIQSLYGNRYVLDMIDTNTITLVADIYEYTLLDGMDFVHRIITEDTADSGEFNVSAEIDPRNWELISPRKVKLDDARYSITAGLDLRVEGQGAHPTVDDDADDIQIPLDWVVNKAITMLPSNKIQSNKLDEVYRRALIMSANEPRCWPNPRARRVIE